ncbi:MAG: hypothetical protein IPL16_12705 [Ignavibacteria bacterium]|nr:hypothetical protein [Ignavibacteria bacterium]
MTYFLWSVVVRSVPGFTHPVRAATWYPKHSSRMSATTTTIKVFSFTALILRAVTAILFEYFQG